MRGKAYWAEKLSAGLPTVHNISCDFVSPVSSCHAPVLKYFPYDAYFYFYYVFIMGECILLRI
jgi:hypothetical protein